MPWWGGYDGDGAPTQRLAGGQHSGRRRGGVSGGTVDMEIIDDGDTTCVQATECSCVERLHREGVEHRAQHTTLTYASVGERRMTKSSSDLYRRGED